MGRLEKVLIGCGAAIIVLMMVTATFSLGVYVGRRGWGELARLGEPGHPPGLFPPPQPPRQPPIRPQIPPRERFDLIGEIRFISRDAITLRTPQGLRTVLVNEETEVRKPDSREPGTLKDLRPGMIIAVIGDWESQGRALKARTLLILPPPPRP